MESDLPVPRRAPRPIRERLGHRLTGGPKLAQQPHAVGAGTVDDPDPTLAGRVPIGPRTQQRQGPAIGRHRQLIDENPHRGDQRGGKGVGMGVHADNDINTICQD